MANIGKNSNSCSSAIYNTTHFTNSITTIDRCVDRRTAFPPEMSVGSGDYETMHMLFPTP